MNSAMDHPSSGTGGTSGSLLIFALPLLAKSSSVAGSDLLLPLLLLLLLLAASALIYWSFPGGPAWGRSIIPELLRLKNKNGGGGGVIPGPRGLPVLGSLLDMGGGVAHRTLAALAESHSAKRLMALSLGSTRMIIASEPESAKQILSSPAFADRPLKQSAQELLFGRAMGFAPYGDYWRRLRRIASGCLFSPRRIAAHEPRRQAETDQLIRRLRQPEITENAPGNLEKIENGDVCLRPLLQRLSLSCVMWSVFGHEMRGEEEELRGMVREGFELLGAFNWSDHLPWLREFDPQGVVQRCKLLVPRVSSFVTSIIRRHRRRLAANSSAAAGDAGDFVDVLLSLQGEDKLEDADMVAVLWEMIFRGTDTTAILTEWVLAELVLNPDSQRQLQAEIDTVCGGRHVTDADVDRLPYLQAVVNETLRLHPPGPLLSWARLAVHDVDVAGYRVPAGTSAMVNMWAITHDPVNWSEPERFNPGRFMEKSYDVRGIDLKIAPFGAGRRVCPGRALGLATVRMWVGRLVQEFFWEASQGSPVDLSEVLKLSCEMVNPLRARPVARKAAAAAGVTASAAAAESQAM